MKYPPHFWRRAGACATGDSALRYLGRRTSSATASTSTANALFASPLCNIPVHIQERITSNSPKLYQQPSHPLHTIQHKIHEYFGSSFTTIDSLSPIVSTQDNFDSLLIPPHHPSRSRSDTYYLNETKCLRTHTSAHQVQLLREGHTSFLCTGDVYRKDDIDSSHYPIFHQMEGVKLFTNHETPEEILADLQDTLLGLAHHLFGPIDHYRWMPEYFPFTHPSVELEILYRKNTATTSTAVTNHDPAQWLEVLGCGVMQPSILAQAGLIHLPMETNNHLMDDTTTTIAPSHRPGTPQPHDVQAWAFGLGLERLAMILYDIPDIRLFWSQDARFWNQFQPHQITQFQPYSKYPPCFKDVSFWIMDDNDISDSSTTATKRMSFHVNDLLDIARQIGGDLIEQVDLVDTFTHPGRQSHRVSHCYRITYRSMDRSLTNEEIDRLQDQLRTALVRQLPIQLR